MPWSYVKFSFGTGFTAGEQERIRRGIHTAAKAFLRERGSGHIPFFPAQICARDYAYLPRSVFPGIMESVTYRFEKDDLDSLS